MMIRRSLIAILAGVFFAAVSIGQQAPAQRVLGSVASIDADKHELTLKDQTGTERRIALREGGDVLRIPPGERDLAKASKMEFSGIKTGDRVLARAVQAGEGGSLSAGSLVVITQDDLTAKQRAEADDWRRRSSVGVVTGINASTKEISLRVHGAQGEDKNAVVLVRDNTVFRRYAPGSVKFADAKPGKLEDIEPGDQLRALGNKDENGRILAETIVSGAFRNVAATVISVDAANSELKLKDLETKKPVTVKVMADSNLRKMPEMMATMIASRLNGEAPMVRPGGAGGGTRQGGAQGGPAPAGGGPNRPGGGRAFDLQQMLLRLPAFKLAELKPGDAIIVAGTKQADAAQLTAITMLAGVEPLFTANAAGGPSMSGLLSGEMTMGVQ